MSLDTTVRPRRRRPSSDGGPPINGVVRLNEDQFIAMCAVLGAHSDEERAALIGMNSKTFQRTRTRGYAGAELIAHVWLALSKHRDALTAAGYNPDPAVLFEPEDLRVPRASGRCGLGARARAA